LKLLVETEYLTKEQWVSLFEDIEEINRILAKILITMKLKANI
jgi:hypothetical protein